MDLLFLLQYDDLILVNCSKKLFVNDFSATNDRSLFLSLKNFCKKIGLMKINKLPIALLIIGSLILLGFVNSNPHGARNLKVLPADISNESLDSLMETYNKGLGVTCDFCHEKVIVGEDTGINFASDANPAKEVARTMIRLTMDINKNYFNYDTTIHPAYLNKVGCFTCHKGDPYPQSE